MEYLFENPIPLLMVGIVLLTFSGVLYFTTRSIGSFLACVIIAVLTISALVMEQIVYTPREQVEVALAGITNAAEENDMQQVLSYLSPTATRTRSMVEKLMPIIDVQQANIISDIDITLDNEKNPTHATARFDGFFHGKHKSGMPGGGKFPVEVELVLDEHRWLIEDFHSDRDFEAEAAKLRN